MFSRTLIAMLFYATAALLPVWGAFSDALAASDAEFPREWETWPVVSEGAIPDNAAVLPADLSPIVRETVKTYNWINAGKGSPYKVRINPAALPAYKTRGPYSDGPTAVLELTDIKTLLVTEHLVGQPTYGAYDSAGKDLSTAHPSLGPAVCQTCHSGYEDACVGGVCSRPRK